MRAVFALRNSVLKLLKKTKMLENRFVGLSLCLIAALGVSYYLVHDPVSCTIKGANMVR
jgi:hypothetical protein